MNFVNRIRHLLNRSANDDGKQSSPLEARPRTGLEEKQELLGHHVRLVAQGVSHGLFVAGAGGLGKSHTIHGTLTSEGIQPVLINSHIAPLMLYRTMFENRKGKVIWLDDCDSIYPNLQILGLLRSALWGQGERIVTYSSSQLKDMPNRFTFKSRIVFCANTIPTRNEAFKAVISRVDIFTLSASPEEVIEQMRILAAGGYCSLSPERCSEVVAFIADSGFTRQISMRLYEPSLKKVLYALKAGIDWKDLVRCQLEQLGTDDAAKSGEARKSDLACLREAMRRHPDRVENQIKLFGEMTGKSRATYHRLKKGMKK